MISPVVDVLAPAVAVLAVVRIALLVKPLASNKLKTPAQLGMPVAGPASISSAHAALRRGAARRPKFRT
jgi:hypothetical protein